MIDTIEAFDEAVQALLDTVATEKQARIDAGQALVSAADAARNSNLQTIAALQHQNSTWSNRKQQALDLITLFSK